MLPALVGIFLIMGLLAFTAYLAGMEELRNLREDSVKQRPLRRAHSR